MSDQKSKQNISEVDSKRIEQIKNIRSQLDYEFVKLLGEQNLTELEALTIFSESVKKKLSKHYQKTFPKKCNNCQKIYASIEEYIADTKRLGNVSTVFDDIGLQEYRNCQCGSTLVVWTSERRDQSHYGVARRKLFDECREKMNRLFPEQEQDLYDKLRKLFSSISA